MGSRFPYCVTCQMTALPTRAGKCPWCENQLAPTPKETRSMELALAASVLFHLTQDHAAL